jgi:FG-GAP repeat
MLETRFALYSAGSLLCLIAGQSLNSIVSAATTDPQAFVERQKITSNDGATDDQFGRSSAIAGGALFNGAYNATERQGAVYINGP